jgi:thioesterase domain-containing protein
MSLADDITCRRDLVDTLHDEGDGAPLFLVHAMGGTTGCYRALAARLSPDRPVYAFKAPRPSHPLYPLRSIEEMASTYVDAALDLVPSGPIHLGGWSMGGLIVFEMARLVRERGRTTGTVALIDTWMRRAHLMPEWPAAHRRVLDRRRWRVFMKLVTGAVGCLEEDGHRFWALDDIGRLDFIRDAARMQNADRYGGADSDERFAADRAFYLLLREASDAYRPAPLEGTTLCIGAQGAGDQESAALWSELSRSGCRVAICPGDHLSIVEEPFVAALAEILAKNMATIRVTPR